MFLHFADCRMGWISSQPFGVIPHALEVGEVVYAKYLYLGGADDGSVFEEETRYGFLLVLVDDLRGFV